MEFMATIIKNTSPSSQAEHDYYKAQANKYHVDAVHAAVTLNQAFEQISPDQHIPITPE